MTDWIVQLQPGVTAEVVQGGGLHEQPRFGLPDSLIVAPYKSMDEREAHYVDTIGSSNWYAPDDDELRFGKDYHLLHSVWLGVPEVRMAEPGGFAHWLEAPAIHGSLRLVDRPPDELDLSPMRHMDADAGVLIALYPEALAANADRRRLSIAQDVDLLVADGRASGWNLHHPEPYLVNGLECPELQLSDTQLATRLNEYFALVNGGSLDALVDADPDLRRALLELKERIEAHPPSGQRDALHWKVNDVLEQFYE